MLFDSLMGIRAALYYIPTSLKTFSRGEFAGTGQFINFASLEPHGCVLRQESGQYQPEPIWTLAFLGISRFLRYVFGLACSIETGVSCRYCRMAHPFLRWIHHTWERYLVSQEHKFTISLWIYIIITISVSPTLRRFELRVYALLN